MGNENLASLLGVKEEYVDFNREERNYAALLYHYLMSSGAAMDRFLKLIDKDIVCESGYPHTYFEYAHARDLWEHARQRKTRSVEARNALYFKAIAGLLESDHARGAQGALEEAVGISISGESPLPGALKARVNSEGNPEVHAAFVTALNQTLVAGKPSVDQLQSPGRWSASKLAKLQDRKLAISACRLKWAFNAKADLVIHTGPHTAVCVEIKVDSKTAAYSMPGNPVHSMDQIQLQRYILKDLLGYRCHFALLGRDPGPPKGGRVAPTPSQDAPPVKSLFWPDVFAAVLGTDFSKITTNTPGFVERTLGRIC